MPPAVNTVDASVRCSDGVTLGGAAGAGGGGEDGADGEAAAAVAAAAAGEEGERLREDGAGDEWMKRRRQRKSGSTSLLH